MKILKKKKAAQVAVKTWKKLVHNKIDRSEALWNRSELLAKCYLPLECRRHPCLTVSGSNFSFMMVSDIFDPPDVVEKELGGKIRPCYLCGEKEKDRFSHLCLECQDKNVVAIRDMFTVILEFCRMENFLNLTLKERKKDSKEEEEAGVQITRKKLKALVEYLRRLYKLRKKKRKEMPQAIPI